ncbi:MAG: hypothetical protein GY949_21390 [Gammaproteobacteria bacterium]|nr:hypothetical protein [Gammaproteobacteria bacterium]
MKQRPDPLQLDLFDGGAPVVVLAPEQKGELATQLKALFAEIATMLAGGEISDDQDLR